MHTDVIRTEAPDTCALELEGGERFPFGENWRRFLALLDDRRIAAAERSVQEILGQRDLAGLKFLDIGSGSGLFSLVARRLGATVHSLDLDPQSVACAQELRRRFFPGDSKWTVERGSALDGQYIQGLGQFDVVYSWGVLHHTGEMWKGLDHAARAVAPGGRLVIAIYNDEGRRSVRWRKRKAFYNRLPRLLQPAYVAGVVLPYELKQMAKVLLAGRPGDYLRQWTQYHTGRGMNRWHDMVDWVGGYPFEVARPDAIVAFYRARGFVLTWIKTDSGSGCNEYLFHEVRRGKPAL
jgi:2-polyprenyl-3-methyl-5-hydroxy-6-metoxy-1,4-benzoquinol methylase